jgi:hypothetical protein
MTEQAKTPEEIRAQLKADHVAFVAKYGPELSAKWGPLGEAELSIDRVAEYIDGNRAGTRNRLESVSLPLAQIVGESYTIDGLTLTVPQILAFVNEVVDAHKGDGLA